MVKIYFIAGESSGDFIGSQIIQQLKSHAQLDLVGVGGEMMMNAGMKASLFNISALGLIGFAEIIPNIFKLKRLMDHTVQDVLNANPDLLITIDSPGFTFRIAKRVRANFPKLKMLHIVAPSVWAYKSGRALKYAAVYDYLFTLFPFETAYFAKVGLECHCIGHPIFEQKFYEDKHALRTEFKIANDAKVLCITSGSRSGEIARHLPIFIDAVNKLVDYHPNITVIFPYTDQSHVKIIQKFLAKSKFDYILSKERLKAYAVADLALAKSGTNTLEIAASGTPLIVAYKLNIFSYFIIRALIKVKYISIINIVANKALIPELLQFDCTTSLISTKLNDMLKDPIKRNTQVIENRKILEQLGLNSICNPSTVAAMIIKNRYLSIL